MTRSPCDSFAVVHSPGASAVPMQSIPVRNCQDLTRMRRFAAGFRTLFRRHVDRSPSPKMNEQAQTRLESASIG